MRVLVIENFIKTPLGQIEGALSDAGAAIDLRRVFAGDPVPDDASGHDAMVVLGGAQSALDDAEHPYLAAVAALTRKFGAASKAVLGVCLGAQLVARGHGARNLLGRPVEFGWRDVLPTAAGRDDPLIARIGQGAPLFHWHTDTFSLPPGAVHLASSDMTAVQAFRIGEAVYGLQFHFEADRPLVTSWTADFADVIAEYDPGWTDRMPDEAAQNGPAADAAGAAIARAWVDLATDIVKRGKPG